MRFPKLSELLGKTKLGPMMAKLFPKVGMQTMPKLKVGEEQPGPGFLRRLFSREPEAPKRPRTATPPAASVMQALTTQRRQRQDEAARAGRRSSSTTPAAGGQQRSRPIVMQQAGNVFNTIRNIFGGQSASPERPAASSASASSPRPEAFDDDQSRIQPTTAAPDLSQAIPSVSAASAVGHQPQAPALGLGAMIQWRTGGTDQFSEPRRVNYVSEDRRFVRVEGSSYGIPADQVTVVRAAPPGPSAAPQSPASPSRQSSPRQSSQSQQSSLGMPIGNWEPVWKMILREKWQSFFGKKAHPARRSAARSGSARKRPTTAMPDAASVVRGAAPTEGPSMHSGPQVHKHFASFFGHKSGWAGRTAPASGTTPQRPTTAMPDAASVMRGAAANAASNATGQSKKSKRLDKIQGLLDIAGIFDPTPILDGVNAMISLKRAKDEPERRDEHMENAAISGVSMIPGVGDLAKLRKLGRGAKPAQKSGSRSFGQVVGQGLAMPKEMWTNAVSKTVTGVQGRAGKAYDAAAMAMYGKDVKIAPVTTADIQKRGMTDIMSGKKTSDQVKKEIEGERTLLEAKKKLAGQVTFLAGAFGTTGKILAGLATSAVGLTKTLQLVNAARLASQGELGYVSGSIGTANAKREYAKFERDVETGRAIGASNSRLSDSDIRLARALQPGQNLLTNLANNLSSDVANWVAAVIEKMNEILSRMPKSEDVAEGVGKTAGAIVGGVAGGTAGSAIGGRVGGWIGRSAGSEPAKPDTPPPWNRFIDSSIEAAKPKTPPRF